MNKTTVLLAFLLPVLAHAQKSEIAAGLPWTSWRYDIVVETVLPHLEENLRHATVRKQMCLEESDLTTVFPALQDGSLQDCRLEPVEQTTDTITLKLVCSGGHGTDGTAIWRRDPGGIRGILNVKLGGKNMTFYQRITGRAAGRCSERTAQDLHLGGD